jgi:hypothetical protein
MRRKCLLKHVTEGQLAGRLEVTRRQGWRCQQVLDDLKETRGYLKLKEEALDHSLKKCLWKRLWTCRKTDCGMNEKYSEWNGGPSVRPHVSAGLTLHVFSCSLVLGAFMKICREKPSWVKMGQKCLALHVRCLGAGDSKSPHRRSF